MIIDFDNGLKVKRQKEVEQKKEWLDKSLEDFTIKMRRIRLDDETRMLLHFLDRVFMFNGMLHKAECELAELKGGVSSD